MGFSINNGIVRGDLFNRRADGWSGKWKHAVEIDMSDYCDGDAYITPIHAVMSAVCDGKAIGVVQEIWAPLRRERDAGRLLNAMPSQLPGDGYWLVVLEPYHQSACPVMVAV